MPEAKIEVISDPAALEALRPEWSELWRDDPRATPFQSPEWLLAWRRHLFAGGQLWVVAGRRDGRLISLLPLFRYGARLQNLAFLGAGITDYLDSLGEPTPRIPGDWEHANLEELRPDSPLLELSAPEQCSVCPVIHLPSPIDPKLAIDIRRSSNRLHQAGQARIERTTHLDDLFALHAARWRERNEEGVLAEAKLQDFHREVAAGFDRLGILRLYRLLLDDRAVAVVYAFTHRRRVYGYLTGFDPGLSKLSPGTVLLAHIIHESLREGALEFDFLRNPEPYKYRWGARDHINYRVNLRRGNRTTPGPDPPSPD